MTAPIKIIVFILGGVFTLIGIVGLFAPAVLAGELGLTLTGGEGAASVRAMIGAHYLAMGGVCLYAAARNRTVLLLPVGAIEAMMVVARALSILSGEFVTAAVLPTIVELAAAGVLLTTSLKALRSQ
ncbi:MAG: hypothetical protein AAFR03_10035 [Pseudomonadota bacterium]